MAAFALTIPDALVPRIRAAFGSTDLVTGILTPATMADIQEEIRNFIRARVANHEADVAASSASSAAIKMAWQ